MKSKFIIPAISLILIIVAVLSAFVAVKLEKGKDVQLTDQDVKMSNIVVNNNKLRLTITSADSLGMKITGNSYTFEDGKLKFKLFGKKDLKIGKPLTENQVMTLVIEAPAEIKEVYFVYMDDKGKEKESLKSYSKGEIWFLNKLYLNFGLKESSAEIFCGWFF